MATTQDEPKRLSTLTLSLFETAVGFESTSLGIEESEGFSCSKKYSKLLAPSQAESVLSALNSGVSLSQPLLDIRRTYGLSLTRPSAGPLHHGR